MQINLSFEELQQLIHPVTTEQIFLWHISVSRFGKDLTNA